MNKGQTTVALPEPNGDFYQITENLNDKEREKLKEVRAFMDTRVAPVITKYWAEDAFPFELIPGVRELDIASLDYEGYGGKGWRPLLNGFTIMLMSSVDPPFPAFFSS